MDMSTAMDLDWRRRLLKTPWVTLPVLRGASSEARPARVSSESIATRARLPRGWHVNRAETVIGHGRPAYERAANALQSSRADVERVEARLAAASPLNLSVEATVLCGSCVRVIGLRPQGLRHGGPHTCPSAATLIPGGPVLVAIFCAV